MKKEKNSITVEVSEKIEFFIVTESRSVDQYHTGDRINVNDYIVKRKMMFSDIPEKNGGTKKTDRLIHTDVFLMWEKDGIDDFGKFYHANKQYAEVLCNALNNTDQNELLEMINNDEFKNSVAI